MTVRHPGSDSNSLGAVLGPDGRCTFRVWAPAAKSMHLVGADGSRCLPMESENGGYWRCTEAGIAHGFTYRFRIDGGVERPDPASQWQPEGVHGPSAVVDHARFCWTDREWTGIDLQRAIIYELHTGVFTLEGTFDGVVRRLEHLRDLGITAVEIMPVAQFPGERNWGYDGVHPFAVQTSYGGVDGLKRLVDACHGTQIAVILDVVYNHFGPEGNYVWEYGPYFTQNKYRTPWGWAVNFDDAGSDDVRAYFSANALYWLDTFHVDGLRLDAVHSIFDMSASPFLKELAAAVRALESASGRKRAIIGESDLNDPRLVQRVERGGYGLDAQWSDDLHHALHAVLTGERSGYYGDFGERGHIVKSLRTGYTYAGDYSAQRKRRHGATPRDVASTAFIVCAQNHDQVGNRMLGDRLVSLAGANGARLAAAVVLLSPMVPMLFMGEEWGETNPFLYFVDHGDPALNTAVREGRAREFEAFHQGMAAPDPTSVDVFTASRLNWNGRNGEPGARFLGLYRRLIELRKSHPALADPSFETTTIEEDPRHAAVVFMTRRSGEHALFCAMNFGESPAQVSLPVEGAWRTLIDTDDVAFGGTGAHGETDSATVAPRSLRAWDRLTLSA